MTRAAAKPQQMAVVSIGFTMVLLPADEGMKIVKALQQAAEVKHAGAEHKYAGYVVEPEALRVEFALARANEVHVPHGEVVPVVRPGRAALPPPQQRRLK